jgi:hypothetical protein
LLNATVMKTGTILLLALGLAASASLSIGCIGGCDAAGNGYRAPLQFTPSTTLAFRTPSTCGAVDPAFTPQDSFSLELTGEETTIEVDLAGNVITDQPVALVVNQTSASNVTAQSQDGSIHFSFQTGSQPSGIDATALDSVVVTASPLPNANGAPVAVEIQLTFDDGHVLDQTYSAGVQTTFVSCPTH